MNPAVNSAGGLLCLWQKCIFTRIDTFMGKRYLGVKGYWGQDRVLCHIVNIYSPCDMGGKSRL